MTRVQRLANEVLGRFYMIRMLHGYDEVEGIAPGLAGAVHHAEASVVRWTRR